MKFIAKETEFNYRTFRKKALISTWKSIQIVKVFIDHVKFELQPFLMLSIEIGALESVKYLIEEKGQIIDEEIVILSCHQNQLSILKYLLEKQPKFLNKILDNRETLLTISCYHGYTQMGKYLIQIGADLEISDRSGFTPLLIACSAGSLESVQLIANSGANLKRCNQYGEGVVHLLCKNNQLDILKHLVEKFNADIHQINNRGESALWICCDRRNLKITEYLIDKGIDPNVQTIQHSETALHHACNHGYSEIVMKLIQSKSLDFNSRNSREETALHIAVRKIVLKL